MTGDWKTAVVAGRPWQDLLFSVAGCVFIVGLVPMLLTGVDVPLFTGVSTAAMLCAFALAHVSYGNWLSVATELAAGTIWVLLAVSV